MNTIGLLDVYTGVTNILNVLKSDEVQANIKLVLKGLGELGLMKVMTKAMSVPSETSYVKEDDTKHTVDIGKA